MSVDVFSTAKGIIVFVLDHFEKMGTSDGIIKRIIEELKYINKAIMKIEPYIKTDCDTEFIKEFSVHLQNIYEKCKQISEKDIIEKFALAESIQDQMKGIETQVNLAYSKLQLFLDTNQFIGLNEAADNQKESFIKGLILQENPEAGLKIIKNKSVKKPPAPPEFTAREDRENFFKVEWKPPEGAVEKYEVCYNDQNPEGCIIPVSKEVTCLSISSRRVSFEKEKKLYSMKVRAVNDGGPGEWSQPAVVQLTKPVPQNPDIAKLLLQSTIGLVTVTIPRAVCSTESPVTCIEISSIIAPEGTQWHESKFEITPAKQVDNTTHTFKIKDLHPESKYSFRVRSKNAEGWSNYSSPHEDRTLPLPLLPGRPHFPIIKASGKNMVHIGVKLPKSMCSTNSPIIALNIKGYATGLYNPEIIEISEHHEPDSDQNFIIIPMEIPDPRKIYTLRLLAKNESGWGESSEEFIIDITKPLIPKNFRSSGEQSLSQISILWEAPDCEYITHYEIKRRVINNMYGKELVKVPANKLKFSATFKNLRQNTSYCFKIRTCYEVRISEWSREIEASTCSEKYKSAKATLSPIVKAIGAAKNQINEKRKVSAKAGTFGAVGGEIGQVEASSAATGSLVDETSDQNDKDNEICDIIIECPKEDNA